MSFHDRNEFEQNEIINQVRNNLNLQNQRNNGFLPQGQVNVNPYSERIRPHYEQNRPNMDDSERDLFKYQKRRENIHQESELEKRSKTYRNTLDTIKDNDTNAFRLFELKRNFTLKQLKKRYIVLSRLTHPDKQGGSDEKFELVTKYYLYLLDYYNRIQEKNKYESTPTQSFDSMIRKTEMKRENQDEYLSNKMGSLKIGEGKQFDVDSFNKIFEKNVFYDPNHQGYGNWLRESNEEKAKSAPKMFGKKFNQNVFNASFEKERQKMERSIVPISMENIQSANEGQYTSIDILGDTNNYSTTLNSGLNAVDLKEVYSSGLIGVSTQMGNSQPKFKSQREYEAYRSSRMTPLSQQERERVDRQKLLYEKNEENRLHRLAERDSAISEHFMRIQGLLQ